MVDLLVVAVALYTQMEGGCQFVGTVMWPDKRWL
jgi:hypothetical protein